MEQVSGLAGLRYLLPEMALLATAAAALFAHIFSPRRGRRAAGWLSLLGYAAGAALVLAGPRSAGELYSGSLVVDGFALFFKLSFLLAAGLSTALAFRFFDVEGSEPGEAYALMPLTVIGMMVAASSVDLITTYVAFELFAIPSYVLAGIFKKDRRSAEAGVKYFFLGSLSSAVMLLGLALVYGLTGETQYRAVAAALAGPASPLALAGLVLVLVGLLFKAAMVPFHMWAPDVYEGAPTPLVVFLSTAPKAAVFALAVRLLAGPFGPLQAHWTPLFQAVAVATMFWGNIAALAQKNLKRLMAYSSVAHAGYLAIGLAAWGEMARWAIGFYVVVYVLMNAAAFGLALLVLKEGSFGENVEDLAGLVRRSPLAAASILVLLLSLTGIPPTAGFMGKYFLFAAAVGRGMPLLALAGALNSVISLFYYFRIGKAVFLDASPDGRSPDLGTGRSSIAVLVLAAAALALLVLGIAPSLLGSLAVSAALGR